MADSMEELKEIVSRMRADAQGRLRKDKDVLFPHVPIEAFNAIVAAVGEISIIEARVVLRDLELEYIRRKHYG